MNNAEPCHGHSTFRKQDKKIKTKTTTNPTVDNIGELSEDMKSLTEVMISVMLYFLKILSKLRLSLECTYPGYSRPCLQQPSATVSHQDVVRVCSCNHQVGFETVDYHLERRSTQNDVSHLEVEVIPVWQYISL